MENPKNGENGKAHDSEFKRFAATRIIVISLVMIVAIWVVGVVIGFFEKPADVQVAQNSESHVAPGLNHNSPQPEALHKAAEKKPSHEPSKEGHDTATESMQYDKDTAGGIMSTEFIALDKDLTAKEAIEYLKRTHQEIKQPTQLFVVDVHEKLLGGITLNQLLFASSDAPLQDIMSTHINAINVGIGTERVKALIDQNHLQSVPVIDQTNKLVGVVNADQVVHLAEQQGEKTPMHATAPTHEAPVTEHETQVPVQKAPKPTQKTAEKKAEHPLPTTHEEKAAEKHEVPIHKAPEPAKTEAKATGVAFVEATIAPLNYELNDRFWGWRSNDILNFTDNINNYQLGVLEVTRRTVVALTERISRTGATAAFDDNLENAMNWLMIKARKYWFPSPESKYNASLNELRTYEHKLEKGEANFYTRTDNLIPLLAAYEDLLGSCEENLVKTHEDDGSPVSFFKADDYFYYAQGVASAMGTILEAVLEDFHVTIESRRGTEVLHHAIESCHHAAEIHPWIITNSRLGGILANHRANLAAPMSHARFFIGVLIKTLST